MIEVENRSFSVSIFSKFFLGVLVVVMLFIGILGDIFGLGFFFYFFRESFWKKYLF